MGRFTKLMGNTWQLLGLVLLLLASSTPAWAQQRPVTQGAEADWVLSYALVILSIGLGVFMVCRPGRRGKDIRRSA